MTSQFGSLSETSELRVLVSVIAHGSFAKAADEHQMTPSGVSKLITRLEDRLGARLLQRTTRRLSLTEAGSIFHSRALRLLHDLSEAEAEISANNLQPRGVLRLSAPMPFGTMHLAPLIPKMAKLFPELTIDVVLTNRFVDLVDEGIDLAIRLGVLPDSRLIARRLCANHRILIASPSYLKKRPAPKTPADLAKHECLIFTSLADPRDWRLLGKSGSVVVAVDGRIASNNAEVLFEAIKAGHGIGLGATYLVHEALKRDRSFRCCPATSSDNLASSPCTHPPGSFPARCAPPSISLPPPSRIPRPGIASWAAWSSCCRSGSPRTQFCSPSDSVLFAKNESESRKSARTSS